MKIEIKDLLEWKPTEFQYLDFIGGSSYFPEETKFDLLPMSWKNKSRTFLMIAEQPFSLTLAVNGKQFQFPEQLHHIYKAIQKSEYIKDLNDDWDGEDAQAIPYSIYNVAIELLTMYAIRVFKNFQIVIKAPEINPGRDGSVDLEWRGKGHHLLISIQNSQKIDIHYYGDDTTNNTIIKGFLFDLSELNDDLSFWMRKLKYVAL
jgi:hypothetical protein